MTGFVKRLTAKSQHRQLKAKRQKEASTAHSDRLPLFNIFFRLQRVQRVISHLQRSIFSPFYYAACDWSMLLIIRYSALYKRRCAIKVFLSVRAADVGCVCAGKNWMSQGKPLMKVSRTISSSRSLITCAHEWKRFFFFCSLCSFGAGSNGSREFISSEEKAIRMEMPM